MKRLNWKKRSDRTENQAENLWKSESGTTMVEVLVAFSVLILIMGIFSQAMSLAGRMLKRSDDTLVKYRELAGDYYLEETDKFDIDVTEKNMVFRRSSGGSEEFSIPVKVRIHQEKDGSGKLAEVVYETE